MGDYEYDAIHGGRPDQTGLVGTRDDCQYSHCSTTRTLILQRRGATTVQSVDEYIITEWLYPGTYKRFYAVPNGPVAPQSSLNISMIVERDLSDAGREANRRYQLSLANGWPLDPPDGSTCLPVTGRGIGRTGKGINEGEKSDSGGITGSER